MHDISAPILTAEEAIKREYQRIVAESGDTGVTKERAASDAADEVARLIDLGEVEAPPVRDALLKIVNVVDGQQGASADRVIARLARGEVGLDLDGDPVLDMVVTLGKGDRKSWRFITAHDLRRMDSERNKNYEAQREAMIRWQSDYTAILPVVMAHRTVGAAVAAGAFSAAA